MSDTLRLGMSGHHVERPMKELNKVPSRLPRLTGQIYDGLMEARVMEFQFDHKLPPDGVMGPHTLVRLHHVASQASVSKPPTGKAVVVNLDGHPQTVTAYQDGRPLPMLDKAPCHGGSIDHPSTRGVFQVYERSRHHTSKIYPEPHDNMQFAVFYNRMSGEALHMGPSNLPSHGCIHLETQTAMPIFHWTAGLDVIVILLGHTPRVGRGYDIENDTQYRALVRDLNTRYPGNLKLGE